MNSKLLTTRHSNKIVEEYRQKSKDVDNAIKKIESIDWQPKEVIFIDVCLLSFGVAFNIHPYIIIGRHVNDLYDLVVNDECGYQKVI